MKLCREWNYGELAPNRETTPLMANLQRTSYYIIQAREISIIWYLVHHHAYRTTKIKHLLEQMLLMINTILRLRMLLVLMLASLVKTRLKGYRYIYIFYFRFPVSDPILHFRVWTGGCFPRGPLNWLKDGSLRHIQWRFRWRLRRKTQRSEWVLENL